jgi:hypothetical protein
MPRPSSLISASYTIHTLVPFDLRDKNKYCVIQSRSLGLGDLLPTYKSGEKVVQITKLSAQQERPAVRH